MMNYGTLDAQHAGNPFIGSLCSDEGDSVCDRRFGAATGCSLSVFV